MYASTLDYVNLKFNQRWGPKNRLNIPHIPLFVSKSIMQDLQDEFSEEFDRTSSHRTRHHNDMQDWSYLPSSSVTLTLFYMDHMMWSIWLGWYYKLWSILISINLRPRILSTNQRWNFQMVLQPFVINPQLSITGKLNIHLIWRCGMILIEISGKLINFSSFEKIFISFV